MELLKQYHELQKKIDKLGIDTKKDRDELRKLCKQQQQINVQFRKLYGFKNNVDSLSRSS